MTKATQTGILEKLKQQGHRMTKGRTAIISAFADSGQPIAAIDIHMQLKKNGIEANKTTVYREIEFLMKEKILRKLQFDERSKRYELISDEHTHHLICTGCKKVEDAVLNHDLDEVEKRLKKQKRFKVQRHSLEFYGLCEGCQS